MSRALEFPWAAIAPAAPAAIAEGVEWIRLPLPFPPGHVNVYRLTEGDTAVVVDSGYQDAATARAWEAVGLPPAAYVVVTHFHPDHIGQAARLESAGARIWLSEAESAKARGLVALSDDEVDELMTAYFASHALAARPRGLGNGYRRAVPALPRRARFLGAGPLPFAGGWRVLFASGHSPAHALLVRAAEPVIAAGDILLPGISPNISVWPDDPDADPLGDFLRSLRSLSGLPPDTLVLPAHGLPYRGVRERIAELDAHHVARLDLVRDMAAAGSVTAADVMPRMFDRELGRTQLPFALGETVAHLNRLWHAGEIGRVRDSHGVYRYSV